MELYERQAADNRKQREEDDQKAREQQDRTERLEAARAEREERAAEARRQHEARDAEQRREHERSMLAGNIALQALEKGASAEDVDKLLDRLGLLKK